MDTEPHPDNSDETRVNRGAALLDEKQSRWYDEVDLARLAMYSCLDCVLGQVFGDYNAGLDELGLGTGQDEIDHAFDVDKESYRELDRLWRNAILVRRSE